MIPLGDLAVTVSDENEDATPQEESTTESVADAAKAAGTAEAAADQAKDSVDKSESAAEVASESASEAIAAAQASADSAMATAITGAEVNQRLDELNANITRLIEAFQSAPVDQNNDGIPDPVTPAEIAPADQEPSKRTPLLQRRWGRRK